MTEERESLVARAEALLKQYELAPASEHQLAELRSVIQSLSKEEQARLAASAHRRAMARGGYI